MIRSQHSPATTRGVFKGGTWDYTFIVI